MLEGAKCSEEPSARRSSGGVQIIFEPAGWMESVLAYIIWARVAGGRLCVAVPAASVQLRSIERAVSESLVRAQERFRLAAAHRSSGCFAARFRSGSELCSN